MSSSHLFVLDKSNVGAETPRKVRGVPHALTSFEFVRSLVATMKILGYVHGIIINLHLSEMNQALAYNEVTNAMIALQHTRHSADVSFNIITFSRCGFIFTFFHKFTPWITFLHIECTKATKAPLQEAASVDSFPSQKFLVHIHSCTSYQSRP